MGNSKSQLKRSRSEYGSTRSVAFSLPSSWDRRRRSYAYGEPARRAPSIVSSQSAPSYPKPILRNSGLSYSNGVMNRTPISQSLSNLHTGSQYEIDPGVSYSQSQSADRSPSTSTKPGLTRHQFNDVYLKNDLKKLFKAQDRSNSVAQVDEDPSDIYNSTASLDRRLGALKNQRMRSHADSRNLNTSEPRKEGATEKRIRSKKAKKAPLPQNLPDAVPLPKVEGKYRKKRPAPAPPSINHARSVPSLLPEAAANIPTTSTASLLDEIDKELKKNTISGLPQDTESESIPIPKPDYDMSQRYPQSQLASKIKGTKPIPPPKPVLSNLNSTKPVSNSTSTSEPATDPTPKVTSSAVPSASSPQTSSEPAAVPSIKKEMREIATQYDAPVEIAIQCDGNTLRLKSPSTSLHNTHTSSSTSLAELFQLFTQAARVSDVSNDTSMAKSEDTQSLCSDSSSGRSRNSNQQKIVHMDEVLAGVPTPPPLPVHTNVKLIQMRTITENTPVSLAPTSPPIGSIDDASSEGSPTPQRNFNTFQQELLFAYDKLNKKRKDNQTTPDALEDRRLSASGSSSSSEASALKIFKHSESIMGITPSASQADAAIESDSGNDEPSDYGSSLSQSQEVAKSLPSFVLDDIARTLPAAESDLVSSKSPLGSEKSRFHSIKKLKRSMKNALSSISKGSSKQGLALSQSNLCEIIDDDIGFGNENWTFSGRTKVRQSVLSGDTFSFSAETPKIQTLGRHRRASLPRDILNTASTADLITSRKSFSQTNMNSFSLLTPTGYQGSSVELNSDKNLATANSSNKSPSRTAVDDNNMADVQSGHSNITPIPSHFEYTPTRYNEYYDYNHRS